MRNMNNKSMERGIKMFRITGALLLSAAAAASATVAYENDKKIDQKVESIESKKGVDIGGTVRAVYVNSHVSSDQDVNAYNVMPDREVAEFVQMDLDFVFRPWDNVRVNAKMRTFAGMQDYFAAAATSVSFPWINVEGNIGQNFYWIVGDFRQSISPLTINMPGLEIMYEPMIFARKKETAFGDALIEGSQRNMQGVNLQFRHDLGSALGEVRAEGIFARLRRGEYLDYSGYEGNILPNENIEGASQAGSYDKYAIAANLELYPMDRNLMVAATLMRVMDDENSINRNYFWNEDDYEFKYYPTNYLDSLPQDTKILSGRVGADIAGILGSRQLVADVTAEVALSKDDVYSYREIVSKDADGNDITVYKPKQDKDDGMAVNANLSVGFKADMWNVGLNATYIYNDSSWFNNLAQSPSFVARRILNTDKDGNLTKFGTRAPLYSSFDAMYYFTPRHSPMSSSLTNVSPLGDKSQNDSYNLAPYAKTSYTTATYTRKELALLEELSDPALQMSLPNGLATANRTGIKANLVAGVFKDNAVEVQGLFIMQEQVKSMLLNGEKAKFMEYGAGAKVDVLKLIGFDKVLEVSGSYKASSKEIAKAELTSNFINAGLYWRYFKRFGVSFGAQMIQTEFNDAMADYEQAMTSNLSVSVAPVMKGKQMQWMAGLDYTVAPHAWLSFNYGMMNVKNEYRTSGLLDKDSGVNTNLPDYIVKLPANEGAAKVTHEFTQSVIDATINVEF